MQEKSVDILETCSKFLDKYNNAASDDDKRRYYNILYSIICSRITKTSISDDSTFYNWCICNSVTSEILNKCVDSQLQVRSNNLTILQVIANLEVQLQNLKNLVQKECN